MTSPRQLTIVVHDALQRAGCSGAASPSSPGYLVMEIKTLADQPAEVVVLHDPPGDDPYGHVRNYYGVLSADQTLADFEVQFEPQPYPRVLVRG